MSNTRREILAGLAVAGLAATMPASVASFSSYWEQSMKADVSPTRCPFHLAVINDEITPDLELACKIASQEFGLQWIELRSMWDKNISTLSPKEIEDARKILAQYKLRRSISCGLRCKDPRQTAATLYFTRRRIPNRPHPLFRFLAFDGPEALSSSHQCEIERSGSRVRQSEKDLGSRERDVLQHCERRRIGGGAESRSQRKLHAQLGPRQCCRAGDHAVSGWLQSTPEESNRTLPR